MKIRHISLGLASKNMHKFASQVCPIGLYYIFVTFLNILDGKVHGKTPSPSLIHALLFPLLERGLVFLRLTIRLAGGALMSCPPNPVLLPRATRTLTRRAPSSSPGESLVITFRAVRSVVHASRFVLAKTVVLVTDHLGGFTAERIFPVAGTSGIVSLFFLTFFSTFLHLFVTLI